MRIADLFSSPGRGTAEAEELIARILKDDSVWRT